MLVATPTPPRAFDPARCLACLAGDNPERRACAAARLVAEGYDLAAISPKAPRR